MQHKLKSGIIFLFVFGTTGVLAQNSLNSGGGDHSGIGGSVGFSIGQIARQTQVGTSGSVSEGIQQPYEISVVTAIEQATEITLQVKGYPNPVTDYLTLSIYDNTKDRHDFSELSYQLYNMQGKLIQSQKIIDNQTRIVMAHLLPSTYFLKVIRNTDKIKIFKIIKN